MRIQRFRGEEELKLDSKARMSIPVGFRRVLEAQDPDSRDTPKATPTVIVVYGGHLDGYLECYSVETMSEVEAMIDDMEDADPRKDVMIDMFLTCSVDLTVDDTGRIVLPAKLRDKLGLGQQSPAYCLGKGKTFQLWNLSEYEERFGPRDAVKSEPAFNPKAVFDEMRSKRKTEQGA